jgi:hypothetical protein
VVGVSVVTVVDMEVAVMIRRGAKETCDECKGGKCGISERALRIVGAVAAKDQAREEPGPKPWKTSW